MGRRRHGSAMLGAVLAGAALLAHPHSAAAQPSDNGAAPTASASQTVTVERPAGQVVLTDVSLDPSGRLGLTLTDTRSEDPGWTVSVSVSEGESLMSLGLNPHVVDHTPSFVDSDGTSYAQLVDAGAPVSPRGVGIDGVVASAPRGHGLGVAHLGATVAPAGGSADLSTLTITITVV